MFSMVFGRFNRLVEQRVKNVPFTNITKDVLSIGGGILGGCYGFSDALHHMNGVLWRPTTGMVMGYSLGFMCGLFPYHTFGLLLTADAAQTTYHNFKKLKDNVVHSNPKNHPIPKEV